jgi:hypothetical protein
MTPWRRYVLCALALVCGSACGPTPTERDQQQLAVLRGEYAGRFEFEFEDPHYVRMKSLGGHPADEELVAAYSKFWVLMDAGPRRDSEFTYLNAYEADGTWIKQAYWDPEVRRVVLARGREHY